MGRPLKLRGEATDLQLQVLRFMVSFFRDNHQLPSLARICEKFGWTSATSAEGHRRALTRLGYLERNGVGGFRFTTKAAHVEVRP